MGNWRFSLRLFRHRVPTTRNWIEGFVRRFRFPVPERRRMFDTTVSFAVTPTPLCFVWNGEKGWWGILGRFMYQ